MNNIANRNDIPLSFWLNFLFLHSSIHLMIVKYLFPFSSLIATSYMYLFVIITRFPFLSFSISQLYFEINNNCIFVNNYSLSAVCIIENLFSRRPFVFYQLLYHTFYSPYFNRAFYFVFCLFSSSFLINIFLLFLIIFYLFITFYYS